MRRLLLALAVTWAAPAAAEPPSLSDSSRANLDRATAALDTLRLAQGDARKRYDGAFTLARLGFFGKWRPRAALRRAERTARSALARMREAERNGDDAACAAAAREGAQALRVAEADVDARIDADARPLVERILASFVVHDHPTGHEHHHDAPSM